jgi:TRAP-type C4-dicarboxylate transport system permease small subunit
MADCSNPLNDTAVRNGVEMNETSAPAPDGFIVWLCDGIAHACLVIAALSLLGIVAINGANVFMRYVFGSPFSWAEELMLFLMILGVFTGTVAVTWRNLHIRIDTIVERLPPTMRRALAVVTTAASVAILAVVVFASFRLVSLLQEMDQRSDALNAPSWIPQSFLTIGLSLTALMMVARLAVSFRR